MSSGNEQRIGRRYCVRLFAEFWWEGSDGTQESSIGETREMSLRGAYVAAAKHPPYGARVSLTVAVPRSPKSIRTLAIRAVGHVVRIDEQLSLSTIEPGFPVKSSQAVLRNVFSQELKEPLPVDLDYRKAEGQ